MARRPWQGKLIYFAFRPAQKESRVAASSRMVSVLAIYWAEFQSGGKLVSRPDARLKNDYSISTHTVCEAR